AGRTVVVEEILEGPEVSMFAVTDGEGSCVLLDTAQDHKRLGDGDTGPNTGGMGCYSPVPFVDQGTATWVLDNVLAQVVDELRPYRGVLYAGLMLTATGPKVLEFNCRFGDPEAEVLLPRMPYGVGTLLHACATGRLAYEAGNAGFDDGAAVTVVVASEGYPGSYPTGVPITGVEDALTHEGVTVFHAGTGRNRDGQLVTAGGGGLRTRSRGRRLLDRALGAPRGGRRGPDGTPSDRGAHRDGASDGGPRGARDHGADADRCADRDGRGRRRGQRCDPRRGDPGG